MLAPPVIGRRPEGEGVCLCVGMGLGKERVCLLVGTSSWYGTGKEGGLLVFVPLVFGMGLREKACLQFDTSSYPYKKNLTDSYADS